MITALPSYYNDFHCIADRCRHNCCIGWEIDIDDDTLALYQVTDGTLGARLKEAIAYEGGAHFILDSYERCPFLAKNGLCDIILEKGDAALCQICRDHPRFRNEYTHFEEMGLGLCCEEAARLIISHCEPTRWVLPSSQPPILEEWEKDFLQRRQEILAHLQDRSLPYFERIDNIARCFSVELQSSDDLRTILLEAEKMEPKLDEYLTVLGDQILLEELEWELPLEQLTVYFINRHLYGAMEDGAFNERLAMAIGFSKTVCALAKVRADGFSMEILIDTARLFSAEIEYSDQNIDLILSKL